MSLDVQSALIGALVTVAVVAGMILRQRRRRTDLLFAIFATNLVLWFIATFLHGVYGGGWQRAELASAAMVPATLLTLYVDLLSGSATGARRLLTATYPLSAIVALIALSPLGELPVVQATTAAYVAAAILLTARVLMQSTEIPRGTVEYVRLRYLAIGAVLTVTLAIIGRTPWFGAPFAAFGDLLVMIYVFFLSQVILRDRLLDLNEFLGRMLVLGVLALIFASISGALIVALPNNASGRLFNTLVSVIIVLTLYDPLRERLEAKSIELFFRERRGLKHLLEQLRRTMLRVLDPSRMSKLVLDTLYDERRCTHAAIYLLEQPLGRGFRLEAYRGPEPSPRVNERRNPALWNWIQTKRAPLLAEQLARAQEAGHETQRDLIDAMRKVSADVLLPFVSGDRVLGFLALRDDRVAEPYSTEEIALLLNVADTAVTVIENSQLTRRLLERDRLAAIGEMAAGLAHEIRNPLGAIKGAAQYLEPAEAEGEQAEFLQVIIEESDRLNGVVSAFLDYARPFRAKFSTTDLNSVVKRTAKLVEAKIGAAETPIELILDDALVPIDVDAEQMKQVLLNLMLNGVEATGDRKTPVTVRTRFVPERERIELRVRDRGEGIPSDALPHIFIPFFTTKSRGTGLGLAVCERIINNHGGDIRVQSQRGEGTEFIIRLPLRRKADVTSTGDFARSLAAYEPMSSGEIRAAPRAGSAGAAPAEPSDAGATGPAAR